MTTIHTLVSDIYQLLSDEKVTLDHLALAKVISTKLEEDRPAPSLRMSNFGTPDKQLWFSIHHPGEGEPLPPWAKFKFLYGHILEEVVLDLAVQSGHTVEGRQDVREFHGLVGHMDAIIDGVLVDVKSANSRSFQKFRDHKLAEDDPFGYIDQLSLYLESSRGDDRVRDKSQGAFLAVDKEQGHLCLDFYEKRDFDYEKELHRKRDMLARPIPPERCCDSVPFGNSGNLKLSTRCSYSPYKWHCHPGLRAFQYSYGKVYLTKVIRTPDVEEVTDELRPIHCPARV